MSTVYVSVGSNLGNRLENLRKARTALLNTAGVSFVRTSAAYETEAVPAEAKAPKFLNSVWEVRTELSPQDFLKELHKIEDSLGRERPFPNAPRTIDLDIAAWEKEIINESDLEVPHPKMHERFFVVKPLSDLAPQWMHPILKKSSRQLMEECLASHSKA